MYYYDVGHQQLVDVIDVDHKIPWHENVVVDAPCCSGKLQNVPTGTATCVFVCNDQWRLLVKKFEVTGVGGTSTVWVTGIRNQVSGKKNWKPLVGLLALFCLFGLHGHELGLMWVSDLKRVSGFSYDKEQYCWAEWKHIQSAHSEWRSVQGNHQYDLVFWWQ